jgi:hypothetical protein
VSHLDVMFQPMNHVPVIAAPLRSVRPCWSCVWFGRMVYGGSAAWCNLANGPRVQAGPWEGCSAWEREPGADDEPGPPACLEAVQASAVRQFEAAVVPVAWAP